MTTTAVVCGGGRVPSSLRPLFDPGRPPAELDAVDLVFDAPVSAGLLHALAGLEGLSAVVSAVEAAHDAAVAAAAESLYSYALLEVGEHGHRRVGRRETVGEYRYGVLELTRLRHDRATDRSGVLHAEVARLHEHVYLGLSGTDPHDGRRWPVALDSFTSASGVFPGLQAVFSQAFRTTLTARLPVVWNAPPAAGPEPELIAPPMAEHVADHPPVACHAGPRVRQRWHVRASARAARPGAAR